MLAFMRKFAKSWLALLLFVPLLVGFAVFGVNRDILGGAGSNYVIKAGSRTITAYDFKREFDSYKTQLEQRFQQAISPELAQQQGLDRRVLEELAFRESLDELLSRMGLRASDKMLKDELRKAPVFFDSVTGEFDENKYAQALREKGLTPAVFEGILTDEMRRNQFVAAAVAGLRAPRAYSAIGGLFALEQRDLAYFTVTPASVGPVAEPTEAEINAFIKENAARLTMPEFRAFTVVHFSAKDLEKTVTVDEAEVQKQFAFMKDSLSKPELRSVTQIPAKDAAQAAAIIARLQKGEDPSAVARSVGVTAVSYADKPRTAFFDPAIAAAAFSLPEGAVSAPLKGQFGLAVIKVTKVVAGKEATLEEHRAEIVAKVRGDLAGAKISDLSKVYEDAHEAGATLPEAARKAGVPTTVYAPVTADGRGQDGKPVAGVSPQVLKAVYELPQGGESDIQEAGEGDYFAVRVDRIVPPAMPPMASIRPQMIRTLMLKTQADRMKARAEALVARIRKGETLEAVAASAGAPVVRVSGISRATLQAHQALGRDLVGGVLGARKGEAFSASAPDFSVAVAVVTAIRTGDPQQVAQATEQARQQFTQELFGDIGEAARSYARTRLKTKADLTRARIAIGIDPAVAA
ncbi:MAG TPA: SurA N-terminal domain-containing protein, partial [Caulobacter sp.]|nr:SurA N-terminal domain-containing protein [Caulobacter sp.]